MNKTDSEIQGVRRASRIAASVLRSSAGMVCPGISTLELDDHIGVYIRGCNAESAFLGYKGFPRNACISINEEVIHGIGNGRKLQFGDLVKIDIGVRFEGFIGDVAMTVPVGGCTPAAQRLIDVTSSALNAGISKIKGGLPIAVVSKTIQDVVERSGYSVVREFVGHGVGRELHEDPQVPNFVSRNLTGKFQPGMTVAIEPMVCERSRLVEISQDGWTVVTRDRSLSAHFEHTVLVLEHGVEILTVQGPALY